MALRNAFADLALDGTDPTGQAPDTGGVGLRGWLGTIARRLAGPLNADNYSGVFRDEFTAFPSSRWQTPVQSGTGVVTSIDGNAGGASYLSVTLDPRVPGAFWEVTGANVVPAPPFRSGWGVSLSRRTAHHMLWVGMVGCALDGTVPAQSGLISGATSTTGVVVTTNVGVINTAAAHGLSTGDRVVLAGSADPRINGVYQVTVTSTSSLTIPTVLGNGTYGAGSTLTLSEWDACLGVRDAFGVFTDDGTTGNARFASRADGGPAWFTNWNPGGTWDVSVVPTAPITFNVPYAYAHQPRNSLEISHQGDWMGATLATTDATAGTSAVVSRSQAVPVPAGGFRHRFRVESSVVAAAPTGGITAIAKTGTTTATVTCPGHGLVSGDWIVLYGVRDQTNFPNLSTATSVTSVVDANTFTVAIGSASTTSSYGGTVLRAQTSVALPMASSSIQSLSVVDGRLRATFTATPGAWVPGESVCLVGVVDSGGTRQTALEGLYRLAAANTTSFYLDLEPLQGQTPAAVAVCGGTVMSCFNARLHYLRHRAHGRIGVEIESSWGHGRAASAVPITVSNTANVNVTQVSNTTAASVAVSTNRFLGVVQAGGAGNSDLASATRTTSSNSGTVIADVGTSMAAIINVTAASGTAPTMDVVLQESFDNSTTWQDAWHAPRITAAGVLHVPPMLILGRRRWAWTIGGTTPSFTFSINSMNGAGSVPLVRQAFDRQIVPNTSGSASAVLMVGGCKTVGLTVTSAAGATTNPVYGVQVSVDGTSWADSGLSLTAPPSATAAASVTIPPATWARIYIKTAGVAAAQTTATLTALSQ